MKKHFCIKAFSGLSISPSGSLAPCCLFEKTITRNDGTPFSIWKDDLAEVYNSQFMQTFREKMLRDEAVDACRQCYQVEAHGGYSMRIQCNSLHSEHPKNLQLVDQVPVTLDLKLNNKCNLKCRMCQPRDSHQIYDEFRRIQDQDPSFKFYSNTDLIDPDLQIPLEDVPNWAELPQFKETFRAMLPGLKKISLVGGEPLLLDELYDTLEICVEENRASQIGLVITSNFMHVPVDRLAPILNEFENVLFNISLDAVGAELNYIRFPSNFDRIIQNFKKLYDVSTFERVQFQFSPTIQIYNILYVDDVYYCVEQLIKDGYKFKGTPVHVTFLEFPTQLNIRILPDETRRLAIQKLQAVAERCPLLMRLPLVKRNLLQVIDILEKEVSPKRDTLLREFMYYSNAIDRQRGQRMQDFLPELHQSLGGIQPTPPQVPYYRRREQGWELAKAGKLAEAISCFELTVKESPDPYIDHREMAWMRFVLQDYAGALQDYKMGLQLEPTDPYLAKGYVLTKIAIDDVADLKPHLAHALSLNPGDEELLKLEKVHE